MDRRDADGCELGRSLDDLRRVNAALGSRRTAVSLVHRLASASGRRPVTILDLGTGGADIPIAVARSARRLGLPLRITATDLHPTTLAFARERTRGFPEISVERADLLDLHYAPGSFDIVMSHTTLHHFSEAEAATALREMDRVAGMAVMVTDLARSRTALLGARLLAATAWRRHPITRHDGPVSVRAAFTPSEIRTLAEEVFTCPFRVRRHALFRLSLVVDKSGGNRSSP
jgi:2-polyprenyl-3-methyl-5-hydroxy-6-metoxy-1,4-benzoquinol methylase